MSEKRKWVVEGFLEGNLFIPRSNSNFFAVESGRMALTHYAILEQNLRRKPWMTIFLGLEIPTNANDVCVAYQEMEAFTRALAIEKDVPITVQIVGVTDKNKDWPKGIGFLEAQNFPLCSKKWEPVDHYKDPKNRVKYGGGIYSAATAEISSSVLEKRHRAFSAYDDYRSELVKDYLTGLDIEEKRHSSLSMLYYFKVLERVGKQEYRNPPKGAMTNKTMDALIRDVAAELTDAEKEQATSIIRWRHTKSEAHLIMEGAPTNDELQLCKKMSRFFLERALRSTK